MEVLDKKVNEKPNETNTFRPVSTYEPKNHSNILVIFRIFNFFIIINPFNLLCNI